MVPKYGDSLLEKGTVAKEQDVNEFMKKKASWLVGGGGGGGASLSCKGGIKGSIR